MVPSDVPDCVYRHGSSTPFGLSIYKLLIKLVGLAVAILSVNGRPTVDCFLGQWLEKVLKLVGLISDFCVLFLSHLYAGPHDLSTCFCRCRHAKP
jgi:hypothetical protein